MARFFTYSLGWLALVLTRTDALKVWGSSAADISGEVESETSVMAHLVSASQLLLSAVAENSSAAPDASVHKGASLSKNRTERLRKEQDALQNLFAHLKSQISGMNKGEVEGKASGQKRVEEIQKRLAREQKELSRTNLTAFQRELLINRTRTEEKELQYWKRSRELEHSMFHSGLKMTHGLMNRVKAVMDAYHQVLATGKLSPDLAKSLHSVAANLPKQSAPPPALHTAKAQSPPTSKNPTKQTAPQPASHAVKAQGMKHMV